MTTELLLVFANFGFWRRYGPDISFEDGPSGEVQICNSGDASSETLLQHPGPSSRSSKTCAIPGTGLPPYLSPVQAPVQVFPSTCSPSEGDSTVQGTFELGTLNLRTLNVL